MSATKSTSQSRLQQQYLLQKQDQFGGIDRIESICFPKTPKTTAEATGKVSQSNSKPPYLVNNLFSRSNSNSVSKVATQPGQYNEKTQENISQSPSHNSVVASRRRQQNRSLDAGLGGSFFNSGKENETTELPEPQSRQQPSSECKILGSYRNSLKNITSNVSNNQKIGIAFDLEANYQPTTRSYVVDDIARTSISSVVDPTYLIHEMSAFIKRMGKELNDLCLTKTSEKMLQVMIESHLNNVGGMQQKFLGFVRDKEANVSLALEVLGKCFAEIIEKLGDLIDRLRKFNRKKFRNLVEGSLANTLKEVFEENNKLNLLESITDINVFVNQQRKSMCFWRLSSLLEQRSSANKRYAFFQLADKARISTQQQIVRQSRIQSQVSLLLEKAAMREKQCVMQFFYKWQFTMKVQVNIQEKFIQGLAQIKVIMDTTARRNLGECFRTLKEQNQVINNRLNGLIKCEEIVTQSNRFSIMQAFQALKGPAILSRMQKDMSLQKIKARCFAKVLIEIQQRKKRQTLDTLRQIAFLQKRIEKGLNILSNITQKNRISAVSKLLESIRTNLAVKQYKEHVSIPLGFNILCRFQKQITSQSFSKLKNHSFVQPQPVQEVFTTVGEALEKVEIPTLRGILRTVDSCFNNKKITKHMPNLKQIQFVLVDYESKQVVGLNPIWKKLEYTSLEAGTVHCLAQVAKKDEGFKNGWEVLSCSVLQPSNSSREDRCVQTTLFPLEYQANSVQYLACETVCSTTMSNALEETVQKLGRIIKNRLRESFYRERQHLKICSNIRDRHEKRNIYSCLYIWRQSVHDRLITEKDQSQEKVCDLEKQLLAYKVELEKKKMYSSNIMKELGGKREEIIEIETRLEDLTIEKKAKSKCLATALFANLLEQRQCRFEQVKRYFQKWTASLGQKRLAAVACEQIEDMHSRHVHTRYSAALYLLRQFQDGYLKRLQVYTLKILAYNSVCNNNSQLNFSQLNQNHLRSPTPSSLSPLGRLHPSKSSVLNLTPPPSGAIYPDFNLQQSPLNSVYNRDDPNMSGLHNRQTIATAGFQSPSPLNKDFTSNDLNQQKPFFSSANASNNSKIQSQISSNNKKNANNSLSRVPGNSSQQNGVSTSNGNNNFNNYQSKSNQGFQPFQNHQESNLTSVQTDDSTGQPPAQLKPTQIMNPHSSTSSRGNEGISNVQSARSLLNLGPRNQNSPFDKNTQQNNGNYHSSPYQQQQQQQQPLQQSYSQTTNKRNNRSSWTSQNQQNVISNHTDSKIHHSQHLSTSFHYQNRSPLEGTPSMNSTSNSQLREGGLNKSFANHQSSQSQGRENISKQPSNLGYRLSAKTINFLQKFGRDGSQGGSTFGNSMVSSATNRNNTQRNSSINRSSILENNQTHSRRIVGDQYEDSYQTQQY